MQAMKLSDLVESEGWRFVVHPEPSELDVLGDPPEPCTADTLVCVDDDGPFIAAAADTLDLVYSAAHEIAEHRHGFVHSADMFCEQANILANWCRRIAVTNQGDDQ
jgi:hypothetical protein